MFSHLLRVLKSGKSASVGGPILVFFAVLNKSVSCEVNCFIFEHGVT